MGLYVNVLPRWETLFYCVGGTFSTLYCIFGFYQECQANLPNLWTQPGIKFLGGEKDIADGEWDNFYSQLPTLVPLLAGHVFVGQLLFKLQLKVSHQKSIRLLYDLLAITVIFGMKATLLCFGQSLLVFLMTFQKYPAIIWIVSLSLTTTLNNDWMIRKQVSLMGYSLGNNIAFFISISYAHIRLISAGIELIKSRNICEDSNTTHKAVPDKDSKTRSRIKHKSLHKSDKELLLKEETHNHPIPKPSILDFMTYIFYLPIFFHGPLLTFDEFFPQLTAFYQDRSHHYDIKQIAKRLAKITLVAGFIEVQSHFMYLSSMQSDWRLVRTLSPLATVGLGVWQGYFFFLKYICLFGTGSLMSSLDGLIPPATPTCISLMHNFADIWKYFDVGLYNFIKKYIYIPWGGSQAGFLRQICGSTLAFAFICYWHGNTSEVWIWCCGNLAIIFLENSAVHLQHSPLGSRLMSMLGPATVQRLRGFIMAPLFLASSLQVMYFFFSMKVGSAMVDSLIWKASWTTLFWEHLGFYLALQNTMYIRTFVDIAKNKKTSG